MRKEYSRIPFPMIVRACDAIQKRLTRFFIITEGTLQNALLD